MKYKLSITVFAILSAFSLSSCSVVMASQKKGTSPDDIAQCKNRTCLMNKGAEVVSQKANKKGELVEEIFEVQKPTGSTGRAVMHGTLDVATLGLWEVAGTPMEGVMNRPDKYNIKVSYKSNAEDIQSIKFIS